MNSHPGCTPSGFTVGSRLRGPASTILTIKEISVGKRAVDNKWDTIVVITVTREDGTEYETQVRLKELLSSIDSGDFTTMSS